MKVLFAIALCLGLAGCNSAGSFMANLAVTTTTATPTQAVGLSEATHLTTLAEQAVDLYVRNGNPSRAVLTELKTLVTGLHNTLQAAGEANRNGNSAAAAAGMATFNEAWAAYLAYVTKEGISH